MITTAAITATPAICTIFIAITSRVDFGGPPAEMHSLSKGYSHPKPLDMFRPASLAGPYKPDNAQSIAGQVRSGALSANAAAIEAALTPWPERNALNCSISLSENHDEAGFRTVCQSNGFFV